MISFNSLLLYISYRYCVSKSTNQQKEEKEEVLESGKESNMYSKNKDGKREEGGKRSEEETSTVNEHLKLDS
jgi:hypothetical protein